MLPSDPSVKIAGERPPAQYAQVDGGVELAPIGRVETVQGEALATRADGSVEPLDEGSPVYQGDVVQTLDGAALGIVFLDESTFSLSEQARMVLDELIYDPTTGEGASAFSIVQGVFVFVSGEIAANNPGEMVVDTPVATIGVRGTKVAGRAMQEGEHNTITLMPDEGGAVGQISVSNPSGTVYLNEAFQTTTVESVFQSPAEAITLSEQQVTALFGHVNRVMSDAGAPERETSGESDATVAAEQAWAQIDAAHQAGADLAAALDSLGGPPAGPEFGGGLVLGDVPGPVSPGLDPAPSLFGPGGGFADPFANELLFGNPVFNAPPPPGGPIGGPFAGGLEGPFGAGPPPPGPSGEAVPPPPPEQGGLVLIGTAGNDNLTGGADNDIIDGIAGNDILIGGGGADILTGGLGSDTFTYVSLGDGASAVDGQIGLQTGDLITDFQTGLDVIRFESAFGVGLTFHTVANYDGTNAPESPGFPHVVFDPNSDTLYFDDDNAANGYTVIATTPGVTLGAGDIDSGGV